MALFAIVVPVAPGKREALQAFVADLNGDRYPEFAASREALGVHERTFLQSTPDGDLVLVTLEGDDPAGAFAKFAIGDDAFTQWFTERVRDVHGRDLSAPPPGPLPELISDSRRDTVGP